MIITQIKTFNRDAEINDWLKENANYIIKDIKVNYLTDYDDIMFTVIYETPDEETRFYNDGKRTTINNIEYLQRGEIKSV